MASPPPKAGGPGCAGVQGYRQGSAWPDQASGKATCLRKCPKSVSWRRPFHSVPLASLARPWGLNPQRSLLQCSVWPCREACQALLPGIQAPLGPTTAQRLPAFPGQPGACSTRPALARPPAWGSARGGLQGTGQRRRIRAAGPHHVQPRHVHRAPGTIKGLLSQELGTRLEGVQSSGDPWCYFGTNPLLQLWQPACLSAAPAPGPTTSTSPCSLLRRGPGSGEPLDQLSCSTSSPAKCWSPGTSPIGAWGK